MIHNIFGILCFITSRKLKNATETHKRKTDVVYGEGAMTEQMYQKWSAKFLGSTDILAKFFAGGLSYALEDF